MPGGGVQRHETLDGAVIRELREETGIEPTDEIKVFGVYSGFADGFSDHVAVFTVGSAQRHPVAASFEIAECRFFAPTNLPLGTSPATARRIDEWRGARAVDFRW